MTDDQKAGAQERLAILQKAREYEDLLSKPGWKRIDAVFTEWLEDARKGLLGVDTANAAEALDSLRKWQLAEKQYALIAAEINSTLAQAEEIRGGLTFDEALLMEQVSHEHQPTAGTANPAGY